MRGMWHGSKINMSLALRGNLCFFRGKKGSVKVRKERFIGDLARKREMKNNALPAA